MRSVAADNEGTGDRDAYAHRVWEGSGVRYMTGDAYLAAGRPVAPIAIDGGKVKVTIK